MLDLAPITEAYRTGRIEPHHVAAMITEVDRLQSGGCARDQRTTQFCAEAAAKDAEIARLRSELAAAQAERDQLRATLDSALCMVVEGPDAVGSGEACRSAAKILGGGLSGR